MSEELKREIVERGGQTCGAEAQTPEKKRKRDEGGNESSCDNNAEDQRTSERDRKRHCEEERMGLSICRQNGKKGIISETDLCGTGSVCDHATSGLQEGSGRNVDNTAEDLTVQKVEHGKENTCFFLF